MSEESPKKIESGPESFPTLEEVKEIIKKFIGLAEYKEFWTPRYDEKGLYAWKIFVETADGSTEYEYTRKGPNPDGEGFKTAVFAAFYDKDDFPVSGSTQAELIRGKWNTELTPIDPSIDYKNLLH